MRIADATEVKNRFGQFVESTLIEPVLVKKSGREVAVMLSWREYQRLAALEDRYWGMKAAEAERDGYVGEQESAELLKRRDEKD